MRKKNSQECPHPRERKDTCGEQGQLRESGEKRNNPGEYLGCGLSLFCGVSSCEWVEVGAARTVQVALSRGVAVL